MEPNLTTPPPVPLPPSAPLPPQKFHKSRITLFFAYLPLALYLLSLINIYGSPFAFIRPGQILWLIPSLVVIFSKNKSAYTAAKIFLIIEYFFIVGGILLLFVLFSGSHW
jgi:hypothetical protein